MRKSKNLKEKTVNEVTFLESSDNVFRDLGIGESEAINLLARSQLMIEIEQVINLRHWTQAQAAKALGVAQPRVSDLLSGKIEKFTVDMLMKWLHKLGKKVTMTVDGEVA